MSGGTHWPVPSPTFDMPKDLTYRVEWDINTAAAKPEQKNEAFDVPARFLNQGATIGVRISLCGQTAGSRKMARDQILPFVLVAPSAA